jgi:hypothetical protein
LIALRIKKKIRRQGVFHGFIGVMAFIAYALPFMFVTRLLPVELKRWKSSRILSDDWSTRLWTLSPVFSERANRGIAF